MSSYFWLHYVIFICFTAATRTGDAGLQQAHVNPAFQDETLSSPEKPTEKANDISFAEKGMFNSYLSL